MEEARKRYGVYYLLVVQPVPHRAMQPKLVQSPLVNGILVKLGHCVACACKTHLTSPRIKFDRLCSVESKADLAPWGTNQMCRTPREGKANRPCPRKSQPIPIFSSWANWQGRRQHMQAELDDPRQTDHV